MAQPTRTESVITFDNSDLELPTFESFDDHLEAIEATYTTLTPLDVLLAREEEADARTDVLAMPITISTRTYRRQHCAPRSTH